MKDCIIHNRYTNNHDSKLEDGLIIGSIISILEEQNEITFTCDMAYDDEMIDLANQLIEEFNSELYENFKCFSEFVEWRLKDMQSVIDRNTQTKNTLTSFYVYRNGEGVVKCVDCSSLTLNEFLTKISHIICFSDCSNDSILDIYYDGEKLEYVGWQSNMLFEYLNKSGKTIWSNTFPQWNH